jgi:hypothetical protein
MIYHTGGEYTNHSLHHRCGSQIKMFNTDTGPLMMSSTLDTYYRDCLLFASHKLQGNVILYIILYHQQSYNIAHKNILSLSYNRLIYTNSQIQQYSNFITLYYKYLVLCKFRNS